MGIEWKTAAEVPEEGRDLLLSTSSDRSGFMVGVYKDGKFVIPRAKWWKIFHEVEKWAYIEE